MRPSATICAARILILRNAGVLIVTKFEGAETITDNKEKIPEVLTEVWINPDNAGTFVFKEVRPTHKTAELAII